MSQKNEYAHVRLNDDGSWAEPQTLMDHLEGTAKLAGEFARPFGSEDWARACAFAHDTGKASPEWQRYLASKSGYYDETAHLETCHGKLDHSTPGARFAEVILGKGIGRILSYCIAGHHAGLPDWIGDQASLAYRLQKNSIDNIPDEYRNLLSSARPSSPPWQFTQKGLDLSLWIRMLFSCLVDGDFLDTEAYMNQDKRGQRGGYQDLGSLLERFDRHMEKFITAASASAVTPVHTARQQVLADCRTAARLAPGFFSLTVPTGGGKTLSSLAFALEHAKRFGKRRVIYVIPYTSIIEQNVDVFRAVLEDGQVVEHHFNLDDDASTPRSRLAAENWDAPVIVTTSVQFFESFFAAKTSRCRKLHNIADSVVILDETQLLPVEYLAPILETLRLLCEHYGVTIVNCTATQPALEQRDGFPGLPAGSIREIVSDVPGLYKALRRVEVMPVDTRTPRSWEEIAAEMAELDQVLCIVSDRKSCRELHKLMPDGTYHLSALMCAQHRSDMIAKVKKELNAGGTIRVISTQLVEAGVDIDFPVVYRTMAGLDSIAQAAGRCNREGRLNVKGSLGKVVVFIPPRKAPIGILRKAAETASGLLDAGSVDPIDHQAFGPYFSELYWRANSLDARSLIKLLAPDPISECGILFRKAAEEFKIIDDRMQRTILVPYGPGENLIAQLKAIGPERWLLRKLQRYTVNLYLNQFTAFQDRGSLEEIAPGIFALRCSIEYDLLLGLLVDELPENDQYIVS